MDPSQRFTARSWWPAPIRYLDLPAGSLDRVRSSDVEFEVGMAEIHAGTAAADVDRALFSHVGAPARWRGVSSLGIFKKRKSA